MKISNILKNISREIMKFTYFNRELSWLSFNYRVLQEAADKNNPLFERIKFLAIYSSNLDEFFRVRVASIRSLLSLKEKSRNELKFDPSKLLSEIHQTVARQQTEFGDIFNNTILPELEENNITVVNPDNISESQLNWLKDYYNDFVQKYISPMILIKNRVQPFLKNRHLYLAVILKPVQNDPAKAKKRTRNRYALVEIPADSLPRFIELPPENGKFPVIFLDDLLRLNLNTIFPGYEVTGAYSVKLTRDAELYIDDEFSGNLLSKIKKSIRKRDTGVPSRFLYDQETPPEFIKFLREALNLCKEDLVPGGRYHNFNDLFSFPNPGKEELFNTPLEPFVHPGLTENHNIFDKISSQDYGLFYPYHKYDHVTNFLETAADDENVTSIKITQYRVAKESRVIKALIKAAKAGKDVMAFVELKARFDEELNIKWAEEMEKAGVKVFYSFPGLKVHAKIALVSRTENNSEKKYAYLATGNFNENTARLYTDFGMFTSDENITGEVANVFGFLARCESDYKFNTLMVAQFNMRKQFYKLIDNEIKNANDGKPAAITIKLNSLEDTKMIKHLYQASNAGVNITIIVRGICRLMPGVKGQSENITVRSILDRYLEHSRYYIFHNNGEELIYAASADWMKRNLNRRIEVAFPVTNPEIKKQIRDIIGLQLSDNVKARIIDKKDTNNYAPHDPNNPLQSQIKAYYYLKN